MAPLRADTGRVIVVREQPAAARCQCAPPGSGVQWGCRAARLNKLHHVIARFELINDYYEQTIPHGDGRLLTFAIRWVIFRDQTEDYADYGEVTW